MLCPNGTVKPFLVSLVEPVAYLKSELRDRKPSRFNAFEIFDHTASDFRQNVAFPIGTSRPFRRIHIDEIGVYQALGRNVQRRLLSKAQTRAAELHFLK